MPRLLAIAEEITKLLAICVRCGNPAVHTQRLSKGRVDRVGAMGAYEAPAAAASSESRTRAREKGRPSVNRPQPRRRRRWV